MRLITLLLLSILCDVARAQLPDVYAGDIVRLDHFNSKYVPDRNVDIWFPPAFDSSKEYPVIYMHDGQMLFDAKTTWNMQEWQVDEVATRLITEKQVTPFIVVGVWNNSDNRHSEYFPQKPFESMSDEYKVREYNRLRGGNVKLFQAPIYSDKYLKFLVEELKPFIEHEYKVKSDSSYLLGSSMGGLISWYGLLEYPNEFQGAACLSTHWPGNFSETDNPIPSYFQSYIKTNLGRLSHQKLYFDYGTETLDAMYPTLQKEVDLILSTAEYPEALWHSQKFEGANHSENAWASRLEHPIKFLLREASD